MRLLLVEDDKRIAADLRSALAGAGYVVDATDDGEEAWFLGDTQDYGLVVLDLGLPGMDGLAVLKRWRASELDTTSSRARTLSTVAVGSTARTSRLIIARSDRVSRPASPDARTTSVRPGYVICDCGT